jgi:MFS family permease
MPAMAVSGAWADVRRITHGPLLRLSVGQLLNAFGMGLTLALLVVYLTDVRGLDVRVSTALLAWQAVLALLASALAGTLVDRLGPRPVLLASSLLCGSGLLGLAYSATWPQAFASLTAVALGQAGIWGPTQTLRARLVAPEDQAEAFGFAFLLLNLGIGLGGLVAATIIDLSRPATFELLYCLTAATYVALFVAVLSMGDVGGRPVRGDQPAAAEEPGGSWRDVLADRALVRFCVAGLLLLTFGYGCVDAGVALYMTASLGLPEHFIGLMFAANTAVIVIAQLFVLEWLHGRSRSRALAWVGILWALCWALFAAAQGLSAQWLMVAAVAAGMCVFALGETLWSPTGPAIINSLAPEHLRGRYNSAISILWGVGGTLGPLVTGAILAEPDRGLLWASTLSAGCLLGALLSARLRTHLTAEQDGRGGSTPAPTRTG